MTERKEGRRHDHLASVRTPRPSDVGEPAALLQAVTTGDEQAFGELYDLVAPRVYGLIRRVVQDSEQAEEVAHEVFVEVWRTAARFDPTHGSANSWLSALAYRRAVGRVESEPASAEPVDPAGPATPTPYEVADEVSRLADGAWTNPPLRLRVGVLADLSRTRQLQVKRPPRWGGWRRWTAVAATVVLAGGTGVAAWTVQEKHVRHERSLAQAATQREARIRAILLAPDLVVRTGPVQGGGAITVESSAGRGAAVVLVHAAAPPAGKVYQLWTIQDEQIRGTATYVPGQVDLPVVPSGEFIGVTIEPAGGSPTPAPSMVAGVSFP